MAVVLNRNLEPAVNALVTGVVSAPIEVVFPTAQEIIISDENDSIKIGNGTGTFADVTSARALVVDGSAVTQPVSGTFFQATQPVSGPLTDAQLRATPVPVSGTITATPSGTQDVNIISSVELEIKNDSGNPVPVSGVVAATQSGTWNVGLSTGSNTVGKIDQGTGGASAWKVDGSAVTQPVSGTVTANQGGTWTVQPGNTANTTAWKVDGSAVTQPVSAASLPLPTGAATAALQTQPGVDIGDVTINNAFGVSAVNIQDGGNSITVDATNLDVALSTRLKPADTLTAVTTVGTIANVVHVDDNAGSLTVDNAGVFAVQATLAAETTKVIGTINQGTSPWVVSGTVASSGPATGALTDRSGTATSVSTTLMAANANRKYLFIANATGNTLWFNFTTAATNASPSIELRGNSSFVMEGTFVSTEAITVIRAGGANVAFTAKEG